MENAKPKQGYTVQQFISERIQFCETAKVTTQFLYSKYLEHSGVASIYVTSSGLLLSYHGFSAVFGTLINNIPTFSPLTWKMKRSATWRITIKENSSSIPHLATSVLLSSLVPVLNTVASTTQAISPSITKNILQSISQIPVFDKSIPTSDFQDSKINLLIKDDYLFERFYNDNGDEFIPEEWEERPLYNNNFILNNLDESLAQVKLLEHSIESVVYISSDDISSSSESESEYDNMSIKSSVKYINELEEDKRSELSIDSISELCQCEGSAIITNVSSEEKVCALTALGFDVASLVKLNFYVYFLDYQPSSCIHFWQAHNRNQELCSGAKKAVIISLNTPVAKYFLVCAVIVNDPSMMAKKKGIWRYIVKNSTLLSPTTKRSEKTSM